MSPATLTIENEVATIVMDDGKANAINNAMLDALNEALDTAEKEARAIVIAGRPERFSGGFDLKVMLESASGDDVYALVRRGGQLAHRLYGCRRPVVAACTGHAIAMGAFILLSCDTRIGASGAFRIGANETINNMVLPPFALYLTQERLAPVYQTRAVVQAELYDPEGAVAAGYLDQTVPLDSVIGAAQALAGKLAQLPDAYGGNKIQLRKDTLKAIEESLSN